MGSSMKDVAKLADVSIATVSHVINKTRNVSPETKEKVLDAISNLKYNVNPVARNLRSGNSRMIGFVVSNMNNSFFIDIAMSFDNVLREAGYHLIYLNSKENWHVERENLENLMMQNVDGLIIAPVGDCSYMNDLVGERCPCVFFDRLPTGFRRDVVMSTNTEGAKRGTEILIKKGFRRIAFLGSRSDGTMLERQIGFRTAFSEFGIPVHEKLIRVGSGGSRTMMEQKVGELYSLTRELVEDCRADALFCGNALATVSAISFLRENGYSIPGEPGLVCFDDPFWLNMSAPGITAVSQNKDVIGQKVAELLLSRIAGDKKTWQELRVETNLVIREAGINNPVP